MIILVSLLLTSAPARADFLQDLFGAPTIRQSRMARLHPPGRFIHGRVASERGARSFLGTWRGDSSVSQLIASSVSARIGAQWVPVALKIAKIESGGRCNAANRSGAVGVFQVMHPAQFGISRAAALTCSGGVAAGVAHMARCVAHGARTAGQMMACHNGGSPFARRLEPAYRRALAGL
jgi:hypothetical protein